MDTERHERTWGLYSVKCFLAGTIVFLFGLAGSFTGAITGAIAGRASHGGIIRGAGVGAIAGAALSIEIFEALRAYWIMQQSGSRGQSSIADLLEELFGGRFVEEAYAPAVFTARHWQMRVADMTHEMDNIYGDIAPRGLSGDLLSKLPCHMIMEDSRTAQNKCCTICLQDIEVGEIARSLPQCNHTFHSTCVDKWLIRQGSCPICRQDV